MKKITKHQKDMIFNDLIHYYQFCKKDRRNHIFNAISFFKRFNRGEEMNVDLNLIKSSFVKSKISYDYYRKMKMVALLIKNGLLKFVSKEDYIQAINDAISNYELQVKTKLLHINASFNRIEGLKNSVDENIVSLMEEEKKLLIDCKLYSVYLKKLESAKILLDRINSVS